MFPSGSDMARPGAGDEASWSMPSLDQPQPQDEPSGRGLPAEVRSALLESRTVLLFGEITTDLAQAIPLSDAALTRMGRPGRAVSRFVVIDVLIPLRLLDESEARMRGALRRNSWYEIEARAFAPGGELR